MQTYNDISSAIFDFLLAPFGHDWHLFDLIVWPLLLGVGAIAVYKYTSNQKGIAKIKTQLSMHLLEIRLFRDDIAQVLKSTIAIVVKNPIYIGHNLVPTAVMLMPMVAVMVQLVANYGYTASEPGATELLRVALDSDGPVSSKDVSLKLPAGVTLDAPPVRTADGQVYWRLTAEQAGDHVLKIRVGDETLEKTWAVGGDERKIPVKRLRGLEALLYPGEPAIPSSSPVQSIELAAHTRQLEYLPDGEFGILLWFFLLSFGAGFALKDFFGVTL
jgi:hypothetical protein